MASKRKELTEFAARMTATREGRDLSQTKLAALAGCSVKQINNIEGARCWPSMPIYVAICRALGAGEPPFFGAN
jgi:transcriptional regulator with XRE-family HTH domain